MSHVLDASALLAVLKQEPGAERVTAVISACSISAVNLSEVAAKLAERGAERNQVAGTLGALGFTVIGFSQNLGIEAGMLRPATRHLGLSFGDRACLATALSAGLPVMTSDRNWAALDLDVEIELIR